VVHGGTSRAARDKIFTDFQTKDSPRVIVAHPQTLAHGLTLTEANTIIWYSPTTSLEIYEQANARINRPGQQHKTLIVHMIATPIEQATYTRLRTKQRMQSCLLDLFHRQEKAF
jgi:SNF2 family DNA or RNA helicase